MRFIEVTLDDGQRCFINVANILTITPLDPDLGGSVLTFGKDSYAGIKESIDELMIKIRG